MPLAFRLAAFYFAFFVHVSLMVAYFPPYLAARGLGPVEIGWVLALPQIARIVAPGAWGWFADRSGAQRAVVIWASALNVACFALLPHMGDFAAIAWLMALTSLVSSAALPLVDAITLGALAAQPGRYGVIRLWGSVGFIVAVLGGGAWLERYPVWLAGREARGAGRPLDACPDGTPETRRAWINGWCYADAEQT